MISLSCTAQQFSNRASSYSDPYVVVILFLRNGHDVLTEGSGMRDCCSYDSSVKMFSLLSHKAAKAVAVFWAVVPFLIKMFSPSLTNSVWQPCFPFGASKICCIFMLIRQPVDSHYEWLIDIPCGVVGRNCN